MQDFMYYSCFIFMILSLLPTSIDHQQHLLLCFYGISLLPFLYLRNSLLTHSWILCVWWGLYGFSPLLTLLHFFLLFLVTFWDLFSLLFCRKINPPPHRLFFFVFYSFDSFQYPQCLCLYPLYSTQNCFFSFLLNRI